MRLIEYILNRSYILPARRRADKKIMKIILMAVVLAYISCTGDKKENQIKGDCILVEVTQIRASCGIRSVWIGMKFKMTSNNKIFVGLIHCPDMYIAAQGFGEAFFTAGKQYKMVGEKSSKIPRGDVVINEYSNSTFPIYRIDELKRIDKPPIDPANLSLKIDTLLN